MDAMSADSTGEGPAPPQHRGRRRRRRRATSDTTQPGAAEVVRGEPSPERKSRKRRGKKGKPPDVPSAERVLQRASEPERGGAADEPLTAVEVAEMKQHFRLLHQHRKVLKLKVNAQEDLLLNGRREPTHRGVCLHLLGKVELARVQSAVERLEPQAATRLLAGVVAFSPDINYVLLFLQCVQKSQSHGEASAALAQALRRINFSEVSSAQMRRVVSLLVEVLPASELPAALFGLLESDLFRSAFDRASEGLPDALADIVVPLRAAHAVLLKGSPNPGTPKDLARGCELLLGVGDKSLAQLDGVVRRRLFRHALGVSRATRSAPPNALATLADGLATDPAQRGELSMALAAAQLRSGDYRSAEKLLRRVKDGPGDVRGALEWLEALASRRVGPLALPPAGKRQRALRVDDDEVEVAPGFSLEMQRAAWVWTAAEGGVERLRAFAAALGRATVWGLPSPMHPLVEGDSGRLSLATVRGRGGRSVVAVAKASTLDVALELCEQGVCLVVSLAEVGLCLPNFALHRCSVTPAGHLWLENAWGLGTADRDAAREKHLAYAKEWVREVLALRPELAAVSELPAEIEAAHDAASVLVSLRRI